jgi:hypothetical protein
VSTFDLIDCADNDGGPHCDCFLGEGAACCHCGETPPADEDDDQED